MLTTNPALTPPILTCTWSTTLCTHLLKRSWHLMLTLRMAPILWMVSLVSPTGKSSSSRMGYSSNTRHILTLFTRGGYQINLLANDGHNTGILAQSEQFNVTGSSSSSSTTLATSSKSTTSTSTAKSTTDTTTTTSSGTSTATSTSTSTGSLTKSTGASHTTGGSGASISGTGAADVNNTNAAGSLSSPMLAVAGVMAGVFAWAL